MTTKEEQYITLPNNDLFKELVNKGHISEHGINEAKYRRAKKLEDSLVKKKVKKKSHKDMNKLYVLSDGLKGKNQKKLHYVSIAIKYFTKYGIKVNLQNLLSLKFNDGMNLFELSASSKKENQAMLEDLIKTKILAKFNISEEKRVCIDFEDTFGHINLDNLQKAINERPDLLKDIVEDSGMSPSFKARALYCLGQTDNSEYWEYVISKRLKGNDPYLRQASYLIISDIYDRDRTLFPENIIDLLEEELAESKGESLKNVLKDTIYNIKYAD
ncbi:hypothetical protein OAT67_07180 [Bacteriovoracaceae bacterium]|nr:hypothetical protein [Bacteriovoracaceae bacterium]